MDANKLLALASAVALTSAATGTTPAAPAHNFEWLVGHWCGDRNDDFIEEHWMSTRGDVMLGLSRTIRGKKTRNFEYMRVESEGGEVVFIAQPQGEPPVRFKRTAGGADWARFENPAHDFPNRVEYRRTPTGLHAEIAGPGKDGREMAVPFDYLPCGK
jgi:hypothetical protein